MKPNPLLRLVIAIMATLKIDVKKVAQNMASKPNKAYAQKLFDALGKQGDKVIAERKKAYEAAVKGLTK